jgi:hypothetical protein
MIREGERVARDQDDVGGPDCPLDLGPDRVVARSRAVCLVRERQPYRCRTEEAACTQILLAPAACGGSCRGESAARVPLAGRLRGLWIAGQHGDDRHVRAMRRLIVEKGANRERCVVQVRREDGDAAAYGHGRLKTRAGSIDSEDAS